MFRRKQHIEELDDRALLENYQKTGDKRIIGEFYKRYSHLVFGVCLKYLKNRQESEDAVVAIFEKLIDDLKTNDIAYFRSWLHTVARNHCLMFLRKHQKVRNREQDIDAVEHTLEYQEDSEKAKLEVKLEQLEAALEKLKPEQKVCVELFYLKSKCYQEVADITGFSMKQVKSFLQNGKRNLKNILASKNVSVE